jgi:substrate import-associated zinc metallohydrolase lipoprotein
MKFKNMIRLFKSHSTLLLSVLLLASGCFQDESVTAPIRTYPPSDDPVDVYIQSNFVDEYGVAVRYRYVDRYVDQNKRVTAPRKELVIPMLEFLSDFWVEPFISVPNGQKFFEDHVPAEIVFIGSTIYNADGTVTLGTADAGARITLSEVNDIDEENSDWVFRQLGTIYHEFAHIMHQRYNLPPNWQEISPQGYTSLGSWYNLSDEEALQRGFVSPYGTSTFNEDFAEVVAFLLFYPEFYERYIDDEPGCTTSDCDARNEGREKLRRKYNAVLNHYKQHTGVDLLQVREIIQAKL